MSVDRDWAAKTQKKNYADRQCFATTHLGAMGFRPSFHFLTGVFSIKYSHLRFALKPVWLRFVAFSLAFVFGWSAIAPSAYAQNSIQPYLDRVAAEVTEFTLDNGMKFIVLEQHEAPVASVMLYANVGASNEKDGPNWRSALFRAFGL